MDPGVTDYPCSDVINEQEDILSILDSICVTRTDDEEVQEMQELPRSQPLPSHLPIRKLPDEFIVEILKFTLCDALPSREFALVCKRWKILLLENSAFWRKMDASFVSGKELRLFCATRLRRRLQLSQKALLDVTLDVSGYKGNCSGILFEIVGRAGVHRWRSLTLMGTAKQIPLGCIAKYFSGSFKSLHSLELQSTFGDDPYWPIYELLADSPSEIRILHTRKPVPAVLWNPAFLEGILDLTIPAPFYAATYQESFKTLHLLDSHLLSPSSFPPLPNKVKLETISSGVLSSLNLEAVQSLEIVNYITEGGHKIELPCLTFLALPKNIRHITGFVARFLKSLRLGHDNGGKDKRKESRSIIKLFKEDDAQISMAPRSLEIYLDITVAATLAILTHWPQIQHLTLDLTVNPTFPWKDGFSRAWKTATNVLCPNLVTFKLRTNWDDVESQKWHRTAESILYTRGAPLEVVSWTRMVDQKEKLFIVTRRISRREPRWEQLSSHTTSSEAGLEEQQPSSNRQSPELTSSPARDATQTVVRLRFVLTGWKAPSAEDLLIS